MSEDLKRRQQVDPFLGSDGEGHVFPGAQVPFGFVQLGPDMAGAPQHGYRSGAPLLGFSHTKASGTGGGMWGNLRLLPYTGNIGTSAELGAVSNEIADPGYYAATLARYGVRVELTAARMAGYSRITYPADRQAQLHLDLTSAIDPGTTYSHQQRPQRVELHCPDDQRLHGLVEFAGGWNSGRYRLHFALVCDIPFIASTTWVDDQSRPGGRSLAVAAGHHAGITLTFPPGARCIVRTGLSLSSVGNARRHRDTAPATFDAARGEAEQQWQAALTTIAVDGGTAAERLIFGSALRNVHLSVKDVTGDDPGHAGPHYTDHFALWDTFRTVHPLLTLIQPRRQRDIVNSVVTISRRLGWTFDALLGPSPGLTQGGSHADVLIADAYVKQLDGIDYGGALEVMLRDAEVESPEPMLYGRETVAYVEQGGWIPLDYVGSLPADHAGHGRVASRTLEYNYDDHCIAAVADGLGHPGTADRLRARSTGWRHLWDPHSLAVRPRWSDGRFADPFDKWWSAPWDAARTGGAYDLGWFQTPFYENSAMNYSTFVPHDPDHLVAACGGPVGFTRWLDTLFDRPAEAGGFDPGNEPAFLAPWLYLHAGRPDRTADRVRQLLAGCFRPTRDGWPGNDDSGAMSALYVFAALGLFPNAGQDYYYLGGPLFTESELDTGHGRLHLVATGTNSINRYVQGVSVDGRPLDRAWIRHSELVAARRIEFRMGARPGLWGTQQPPPSLGRQ